MNKKEIALLTETESLERLLYRLPKNHSQRRFLEAELYRSAAGERGEDRLRRKFIEFDFEESYRILRNVSLSMGDWKVQIDGLLLTNRGVIIVESKNISGQLHFDEKTGEFSRIDREGGKAVMEDPTSQLNKHIRFLTKFFRMKNIDFNVDGLVVFTSKQCEFLTKPPHNYVCKTYQMVDYLHYILQTFPQSASHSNLPDTVELLQKHQTPFKRQPLCQRYFIASDELQMGILCTYCKAHRIIRKHKTGWLCEACHTIDDQAFQCAVQEYFSLIDRNLTNKRLREFCNIESPYTASRLLATFDFAVSGAMRNRTYQLQNKE
ncbi:nuclease-related domain-containing protein [Planococcus salinus]|uniref:NERD domain-containing protein n=1 Tax=Planococcus salinus TaxID=1848460 RepID=A0A3M8PAZ2_9BACL|nr:nuclease-related domain-containing protein [Planococcus salinus]RNF40879.1 NERD domain-containing protein [Planococcus salinus]